MDSEMVYENVKLGEMPYEDFEDWLKERFSALYDAAYNQGVMRGLRGAEE